MANEFTIGQLLTIDVDHRALEIKVVAVNVDSITISQVKDVGAASDQNHSGFFIRKAFNRNRSYTMKIESLKLRLHKFY